MSKCPFKHFNFQSLFKHLLQSKCDVSFILKLIQQFNTYFKLLLRSKFKMYLFYCNAFNNFNRFLQPIQQHSWKRFSGHLQFRSHRQPSPPHPRRAISAGQPRQPMSPWHQGPRQRREGESRYLFWRFLGRNHQIRSLTVGLTQANDGNEENQVRNFLKSYLLFWCILVNQPLMFLTLFFSVRLTSWLATLAHWKTCGGCSLWTAKSRWVFFSALLSTTRFSSRWLTLGLSWKTCSPPGKLAQWLIQELLGDWISLYLESSGMLNWSESRLATPDWKASIQPSHWSKRWNYNYPFQSIG